MFTYFTKNVATFEAIFSTGFIFCIMLNMTFTTIMQYFEKRTILICLNATVPALPNDNKCVPKIQFTVHHAETKRRCDKVSASDVFRCAESSARAGAPKLRQQFLVFGMFLFDAPKNSKLAISHTH